MEPRKFKVNIWRISSAEHVFEVFAESKQDAKTQAMRMAGDHAFTEHSAEYELEYIMEEKPQ